MCAYCYYNSTIYFFTKINFCASVKTFLLYSHISRGVKYMAYESFIIHKNQKVMGEIDGNVKPTRSEMNPLVRMQ